MTKVRSSAEKVLVFDDDVFFRTLLTDTLTGLGLLVDTHSSHSTFIRQLEGAASPICPDYILTDNQMPNMTGLEFLAKLMSMGCKTPMDHIAIISGRWDEDDLEKANRLGCQVFDKYNSPEQIRLWIEQRRKDS